MPHRIGPACNPAGRGECGNPEMSRTTTPVSQSAVMSITASDVHSQSFGWEVEVFNLSHYILLPMSVY